MARKKRRLKKINIPTPPVAKLVGFRLTKANKGSAICTMKAERKHENTIGTVHGGILCDLSDAAMGFAFTSLLAADQTGVTVEFKINFLKPVTPPDTLRAVAEMISQSNRLCFLECVIKNSAGQLVAKAASTCKVFDRKWKAKKK